MNEKQNLGLIIKKVLSERRTPNITELIEILRDVDTDSEASKIMKRTILITLGFGEIGDRYPITLENTVAWCDLVKQYLECTIELGQDNSYTKTVRRLVLSSTFNLMSRSFTKKNSDVLFEYLTKEWNY